MPNIFPIQFLSLLAYACIRICIGFILIILARRNIKNRAVLMKVFSFSFFPYGAFFVWYLSLIELILGLLFIFGFLTQIAAIFLMILCLKFIIMYRRFDHPLLPKRLSYILLFVCAISLFITGAGAPAIDLPI
jgi:uncharacterized membrane protein YphA (DoxX/SURF4 family)